MSFLRSNTLRLKSCAFLEQTILNQGQRVATALAEQLAPLAGAGAVVPDFWALQLFFLGVLGTLRERVRGRRADPRQRGRRRRRDALEAR